MIILDSYSSIEDLKGQHPVGNIGDAYLVNGILYTWDNDLQDWRDSGNIQGPKGEDGKTWKPSVNEGGNLTWTLDNSTTTPVSVNIKGEQGIQGPQGEKGDKGEQGDPFTYEDFEPEQLEALKGEPGSKIYEGDSFPEGPFNNGDIFINTTTFDMYYYADSWNQIGSIKGTAVKIRVSNGHLQYGYEGSESWENISSIQDLINQITDKIVLI